MTPIIRPVTAWVSALLFAVHPIHAEALAMVYGQLELLAALFSLLSVGLYLRSLSGHQGHRPRLAFYVPAVLSAGAALCCKESAIVLPLLILLARTFNGLKSFAIKDLISVATRDLKWEAIFWLIPIAYLFLRFSVLGLILPPSEATVAENFNFQTHLKLIVVSVGEAIRLCLFPTGQTLYYGHLRDAIYTRPYSQGIWIVGGTIGAFRLIPAIGAKPVLFGVLWFVVTLLPAANIFSSGFAVAERTLYLPALGLCLVGGAATTQLRYKWLVYFVCTGIALAGIIVGNQVVSQWSDETMLWRTTVKSHPRSPMAYLWLGQSLIMNWKAHPKDAPSSEEIHEAAVSFTAAFDINPDLSDALTGSGIVAMYSNDIAKAEIYFKAALTANPHDYNAAAAIRALPKTQP